MNFNGWGRGKEMGGDRTGIIYLLCCRSSANPVFWAGALTFKPFGCSLALTSLLSGFSLDTFSFSGFSKSMVISQGHLTITGDTEFVTTGEDATALVGGSCRC